MRKNRMEKNGGGLFLESPRSLQIILLDENIKLYAFMLTQCPLGDGVGNCKAAQFPLEFDVFVTAVKSR